MWVNMVHNRHNMLESRSLSGRGGGDNINPQEFKEILGTAFNFNLGLGMEIGFEPLVPRSKGQKHPIWVTQEVEPRMPCWRHLRQLLAAKQGAVNLPFSPPCCALSWQCSLWIDHMGSFGSCICFGLVVPSLLPANIPPPSPQNMSLPQSHLLLLLSVPIASALWFLHQLLGSCLRLNSNFCSNIFHLNFSGADSVSPRWAFVGREGDSGWYWKSQVHLTKWLLSETRYNLYSHVFLFKEYQTQSRDNYGQGD